MAQTTLFAPAQTTDEKVHHVEGLGAALCLSEREDDAPPPLVETATRGYVRLRLEQYSEQDLERWAARPQAASWQSMHAYFMHEPTAPHYAQALMAAMR